jgi:hypothetical protein
MLLTKTVLIAAVSQSFFYLAEIILKRTPARVLEFLHLILEDALVNISRKTMKPRTRP